MEMSGKNDPPKRFRDRPLKERILEVRKFQRKHPELIPVIAHPAPRSQFVDREDLKFIVQRHSSLAKLFYTVRRKLELKPEEALFFTVGDIMPSLSATVGSIYEEFKSKEDDYLYVTYFEENVYGA